MEQQPKRHFGRNIGLGCAALAVLVVIGTIIGIAVAASGNNNSTGASSSTPTDQATQDAASYATAAAQLTADAYAPTTPTTPAPAPKWTTVQTITGNGAKKTAIFTVPDDWKILWSCTGGDYGGYLGVTVYDSNAGYVDGAVNSTCKTGQAPTTGETEEHQGGQVYLDVNGTGDWSLQVQELK